MAGRRSASPAHGHVSGATGRQVRLTIARTDGVFRVEVSDAQSDKMPQRRKAGGEEDGGWRLAFVDALVGSRDVVQEVIGKIVWAEKAGPGQRTGPAFP